MMDYCPKTNHPRRTAEAGNDRARVGSEVNNAGDIHSKQTARSAINSGSSGDRVGGNAGGAGAVGEGGRYPAIAPRIDRQLAKRSDVIPANLYGYFVDRCLPGKVRQLRRGVECAPPHEVVILPALCRAQFGEVSSVNCGSIDIDNPSPGL
jgi:hypothetical protein